MQKIKHSTLTLAALCLSAVLCCSCSPQAKKAGHLQKADGYFNAGHYDEAEIEYMNVLQIEPLNPPAISRLAQIYFDQGRMGRVVPYLLKAKELQPDNLEVRLKLGLILLSTGNVKGAQDEANFVLDRKPQDDEAPLLLADATNQPAMIATTRQRLQNLPAPAPTGAPVQVALGMLELKERHFPEAEAAFRRALVQNPKSGAAEAALGLWYRTQNNLPQAELAFKHSAGLSSPYSFRQLAYPKFKLENGEIEPARLALQEITKKTPDYLPALILLAEISAGEKKYPESAALIAKVLAKDPTHPEALLMNARLKLAQGNKAEAVAELEKILKIYPQSLRANYQLALAHVANGEIQKAITSLNKTLSLSPNYAEATVLLAELSLRKGDATGTIALLKPLVQQRSDIIQAWFLLADAYRSQGNFNEAIAVYHKLEELFPRNPQPAYWRGIVLLQQKKRDDARQAFNHALELSPDFILAVDQLVNLELVDKNYPAADQLIQKQISLDPKQAGPYLLQAKTFLAQNDVAQTENSLHRAIELQPDSPLAYLLLARLYTGSNQLEKALANFRAVTAKNPKDTEALMMTGTLYEKKADFPAAREAYEKLLVLNPRFSAALNNLAYLYSEHFNQQDKAQELAQKARDLLPHEPHTADTLGWILYKKRQYSWALTHLLESAAKLPDSAEVQYHLGMTHYMMGEEQSAREALQRALQLEKDFPGNKEAQVSLSILDINPETAGAAGRASLEKTIVERPEDPIALARLAAVYTASGDSDKAISTYHDALQKSPNNVAVIMALVRAHLAKGETAKALDLAKNARKLAPDDATVSRTLGRLAYQAGDHQWALSLLQEASRKNPDDADTLYDLAEAAYSTGAVTDAEDAAQQVVQAKNTSRREEAQRFLAMTALATNPSPAASGQIEQILTTKPDYVPALMAKAALSEQKADASAAKTIYEKVLTIFPGFVPAKKRLVIYFAGNPADDKQAYTLAVSAREALPNDPELAKAFGVIVYRMGDFNRAASLLRESAGKRAQDAELFYYLGAAQSKLKQKTESRQSLQKALELKLKPELAAEAQKLLKEL
jgi:tetratricopeptide (TPR) repeat protein